jgi:hypothetical protein
MGQQKSGKKRGRLSIWAGARDILPSGRAIGPRFVAYQLEAAISEEV